MYEDLNKLGLTGVLLVFLFFSSWVAMLVASLVQPIGYFTSVLGVLTTWAVTFGVVRVSGWIGD